ncbi:hypothetical protein [Gloeocapsopsis sp. IPPAS B-1203]|uniref:hypothetical protein n=1 Tax=Gloeocapsopsis sp. IPPAS B-1203 TaxID=2049454 RepID=UPI0025A25A3E|nr:hypothetical protein [Gloeocapsopsis sp. IPPAS B-1203]
MEKIKVHLLSRNLTVNSVAATKLCDRTSVASVDVVTNVDLFLKNLCEQCMFG